MSWALTQSFRTSAGIVRYDVSGEGPPIVLVHGTPWSSFAWHRVIPELARSNRVHWYDLPGYGTSEMGEGQKVSLDAQSLVLCELLKHWGLNRPIVVGHDFGGAISLRAHLLHGMEYDRLVLANAVAIGPWGSPFFAHVRKHAQAFAGMPAYIHKAVVDAYIRGALSGPLADGDLDALIMPWLTSEGQAAFYRQIAQADQRFTDEIEPLYAKVRCPTLVIWGEDDPWIPLENGRKLHRMIAASSFITVDSAGHLIQLEQPRRVAKLLLAFLEDAGEGE